MKIIWQSFFTDSWLWILKKKEKQINKKSRERNCLLLVRIQKQSWNEQTVWEWYTVTALQSKNRHESIIHQHSYLQQPLTHNEATDLSAIKKNYITKQWKHSPTNIANIKFYCWCYIQYTQQQTSIMNAVCKWNIKQK